MGQLPGKIQYLDPTGFAAPANLSTVGTAHLIPIGNAPRTLAYGARNPYTWNVDSGLRRTFPLVTKAGTLSLKPTASTSGTTSPSAIPARVGPLLHQPSARSPAHPATVTGSSPATSPSRSSGVRSIKACCFFHRRTTIGHGWGARLSFLKRRSKMHDHCKASPLEGRGFLRRPY